MVVVSAKIVDVMSRVVELQKDRRGGLNSGIEVLKDVGLRDGVYTSVYTQDHYASTSKQWLAVDSHTVALKHCRVSGERGEVNLVQYRGAREHRTLFSIVFSVSIAKRWALPGYWRHRTHAIW